MTVSVSESGLLKGDRKYTMKYYVLTQILYFIIIENFNILKRKHRTIFFIIA